MNHRILLAIVITASAFHSPSLIAGQVSAPPHVTNDTLTVARATWDTGWFQTEVFRLLAQDMGYTVAPAQTMTAEAFYRSAADGSVDFWVNGWFPLHQSLINKHNSENQLTAVGYEVRRGALQGYLVDMESARQLDVESLEQLRDPDIARRFDTDGNGKADLIGCNVDWSCHARINEHIAELDLEETVEQISGDYNPLSRDAIEQWENGQPLLLYTWTPNWTLGEIIPGEDVEWLHVPVEGPAEISNLKGSAKSPITLGYDLNDIRVVANRTFIEDHPDLKILFENLSIPLEDIQEQNAEMASGGGSLDQIREQAREWIRNHKQELTEALTNAGLENPFTGTGRAGMIETSASGVADGRRIRVVTQQVDPLVQYSDREYSGFSIDVFKGIADEIGLDYTIYSVNSIAKMLDDVRRGEADIATAALGITSDREESFDFSHPYYKTGLQILVPADSGSISRIPRAILSIIFSPEVVTIFLFFFGVLLISAHIIWYAERDRDDDFPNDYWKGIGISIWWAAVTVTTVGYGDKTPKGVPGRVFGLIWIFAGYFAFSYFTATITSTVTLQEINSNIQSVDDLYGKKVATVRNSAAEYFLVDNGINAATYTTFDQTVEALRSGDAAAVVYDAPVLQHYASESGYGNVKVTGAIFQQQSYGFALPKGSPLRKEINLGYLKLVENGEFAQYKNRWFGK
ncbi:MAG: glycine betaine/L-proline ABC transporter substrate-binding protein ProX [Bacteroidetes bacterium]|nr:glycine betaine/L-proline ABC transporter substrate-binding protein ProX [Bacteroidota bacterium]